MQGKLSPEQLKSCIFDIIKKRRSEVLTSAALGEDCAVLRADSRHLLLTSDPITSAAAKDAGKLAVEVCCNDIAACGGEPVAVLLTIIAPESCDEQDIRLVMRSAEKAAKRINVEICGGHTEFSDAVNRIVVSGFAVGYTERPILTSTPAAGDSILITKYAALEGTQILLSQFERYLSDIVTEEQVRELEGMEISVLPESRILSRMPKISAMHDITEGGIFGAVSEMCNACGLGAQLFVEKIPLLSISGSVCRYLGINPYKLISSGSMLFTTPEPDTAIKMLQSAGIKATVIGKVLADGDVYYMENGIKHKCSVQPDEITRVSAIKRSMENV